MARDGTLVYSPPEDVPSDRTLVWVYRNGRVIPITAPPKRYQWPRLSHVGTRVAFEVDGDILTWDFENPGLKNFTNDRARDRSPVWMAKDKGLVFASFNNDGPPICSGERSTADPSSS